MRGSGERAIREVAVQTFAGRTQYTASDMTCNWTVNLSIPKCKPRPNAIDQSKLSIEVANRFHRRDCSASTQYAPLHPSRLTGRFLSAGALPDLPVGAADRIRTSRNPTSHTSPEPDTLLHRVGLGIRAFSSDLRRLQIGICSVYPSDYGIIFSIREVFWIV